MAYHIVLSPRADKELKRLGRSIQQRIDRALFKLQNNPFAGNRKFLNDERLADFRVRIGNYRILYDVYSDDKVVYVLRVGHRKDIYR